MCYTTSSSQRLLGTTNQINELQEYFERIQLDRSSTWAPHTSPSLAFERSLSFQFYLLVNSNAFSWCCLFVFFRFLLIQVWFCHKLSFCEQCCFSLGNFCCLDNNFCLSAFHLYLHCSMQIDKLHWADCCKSEFTMCIFKDCILENLWKGCNFLSFSQLTKKPQLKSPAIMFQLITIPNW